MWQQLSAELVRQTHLECSQRGQLLEAAVGRQQQLLHQALCCCDSLYAALVQARAAQHQGQQAVLVAERDAQTLEQECSRLKVRTPLSANLSMRGAFWVETKFST